MIIKSFKPKTFRFYNEIINDKTKFCDVTINININKYKNGKEYYYINYSYTYSFDKNGSGICSHPFNSFPDLLKNNSDGEIIIKNSLSDKLIEYLLMNFDELEKYSGNSTAIRYKISIMRSIANFWD